MLGFVENLKGDGIAVGILATEPDLLGTVLRQGDLDWVGLGGLIFLDGEGHLYGYVGFLGVIPCQTNFRRVVALGEFRRVEGKRYISLFSAGNGTCQGSRGQPIGRSSRRRPFQGIGHDLPAIRFLVPAF